MSRFPSNRRLVWRLIVSGALAAVLVAMPAEWISELARAADGCTTDGEVRATTCRLVDGQTVAGRLGAADTGLTYRVDTLGTDSTVALHLHATAGNMRVAVTDWRGETLGAALRTDATPDITLSIKLPLPGAYGVTVSGDWEEAPSNFQLQTRLTTTATLAPAVWPPLLEQPDGLLNGERQQVRTPRGGSPLAGVAVARALGSPPHGVVADFQLVSDVRFEQIVGPSALTVRFRYEPEAGGGTGYVLSIDPFGGVASLDSFEEGQRRPIVTHRMLPMMPTSEQPNRLIVTATGPQIAVSLDGQTVLEATDSRFSHGLIAVGVVTWSEPVAVTFDHLQVIGSAP